MGYWETPMRPASSGGGWALTGALTGVETLLLIPVTERPDRARVQAAAVDAAVSAGIGRIVYSPFLGASRDSAFPFARDHYETPSR